ncbi:hypothetical protein HMPREF0731_3921, partial [Pseudoroseomonas cervicalis ATCC 49957]
LRAAGAAGATKPGARLRRDALEAAGRSNPPAAVFRRPHCAAPPRLLARSRGTGIAIFDAEL